MRYILGKKSEECVFCTAFSAEPTQDEAHLVLHRGAHSGVIMNLFPYNNGHLMIVPYVHQPSFESMTAEALAEVMALVNRASASLRKALNAEGFNIGVNIGESAGAGIADHVHMHVVPRWAGDTNFITTVASVRCIPQELKDSYDKLKVAWDKDV
jgi:ATP adenylyltransferase